MGLALAALFMPVDALPLQWTGAKTHPTMTSRRYQRPSPSPPPDAAVVDGAVAEVRRRLQAAARRNVAEQIRKEAGRDVPCYGVRPSEVHKIGLDSLRKLRSSGLPTTIAIADPLFKSGNVEEALVGAQIVGALARLITGADFERIAPWGDNLTTAQAADALGASCLCPSLAAKPSLVKTMREWARSSNPSRRRAAVSAFGPLVREGRFMTDALEVAEIVMEDPDEEVQRGVGAMLLEATRLQSDRVIEFLERWKDRSPRLILQVASAKLQPAQRGRVLGQ